MPKVANVTQPLAIVTAVASLQGKGLLAGGGVVECNASDGISSVVTFRPRRGSSSAADASGPAVHVTMNEDMLEVVCDDVESSLQNGVPTNEVVAERAVMLATSWLAQRGLLSKRYRFQVDDTPNKQGATTVLFTEESLNVGGGTFTVTVVGRRCFLSPGW